ncbi:MAG TPA: hypothetical protein VHM25_15205, partial [Polyangiaceae bacterium]|nr:hypothetical protein [Polyangiaceae bacterium]
SLEWTGLMTTLWAGARQRKERRELRRFNVPRRRIDDQPSVDLTQSNVESACVTWLMPIFVPRRLTVEAVWYLGDPGDANVVHEAILVTPSDVTITDPHLRR